MLPTPWRGNSPPSPQEVIHRLGAICTVTASYCSFKYKGHKRLDGSASSPVTRAGLQRSFGLLRRSARHGTRLQEGLHPLGGHRRRELWRGVIEGACRTRAPSPRRCRCHRQVLCPHSRDQPQEAGVLAFCLIAVRMHHECAACTAGRIYDLTCSLSGIYNVIV